MAASEIVYFLQRADGDIKIGYTSTYGFQRRMRALTREHGALKLLGVVPGHRDKEQSLHQRFNEYQRYSARINPRWGRAQPLEWFVPGEELLAFIAEHTQPLKRKSHPNRKYVLVNEIVE